MMDRFVNPRHHLCLQATAVNHLDNCMPIFTISVHIKGWLYIFLYFHNSVILWKERFFDRMIFHYVHKNAKAQKRDK